MIHVEISPEKFAGIKAWPKVIIPSVQAKRLRTKGKIKVNNTKFTVLGIRQTIGGHCILLEDSTQK